MNLDRIAQDLEDGLIYLALAREEHKDADTEYRSGWISGYQAMLAEADYAVATDPYDAPLRPVRLISLTDATADAPITEDTGMTREQAQERARAWTPSDRLVALDAPPGGARRVSVRRDRQRAYPLQRSVRHVERADRDGKEG